jgi:cytidylate kinase
VAVGEVIVVAGPPGAGKSTVAEHLADLLDLSALVRGDDFFGFVRNGAISPWREDAHAQNTAVIEAAAAATGRLGGYCTVVYDGVVGPWFLDTFVEAAGLVHLNYAVILPPLDVCLERVSNRQRHPFTDLDAATQLWHDFHGADINARHVLSDPEPRPSEMARTLLELVQDGTIRYP